MNKFLNYDLYITLIIIFVYKCAGHINFCKIFLTYLQGQFNLFFIYHF